MRRFFLVFVALFLASVAFAQTPNCVINFGPWEVNTVSTVFDNRVTACGYWVLTYQVTGFSAASVAVQSATGATAPGVFATSGYTVTSGSNPSTSVSCGAPANCTIALTGVVGWARVNISGLTCPAATTCSIFGTLNGYKTGYNLGGSSGGNTGCPNPCPVEGTANAGSPPSGGPVYTGGFDGTDLRPISTDATGRVNVNTQQSGQGTFTTGQQAVTGTAVALASNASRVVCVQALTANVIPVYIGPSGVTTSTGFQLVAGAAACASVSNTNLIYVVASTTGASVSWFLTD